jgi:hypothetical protein
MGPSMPVCRVFHYIVSTVTLVDIVTEVTLDRIVAAVTLDTIVAFYTTAAFVIPLVTLLTDVIACDVA